MNQDEKIKLTENMISALKFMWGKNSFSLMLHGVDIKALDPDKYDSKVSETEGGHIYRSADHRELPITFFD